MPYLSIPPHHQMSGFPCDEKGVDGVHTLPVGMVGTVRMVEIPLPTDSWVLSLYIHIRSSIAFYHTGSSEDP